MGVKVRSIRSEAGRTSAGRRSGGCGSAAGFGRRSRGTGRSVVKDTGRSRGGFEPAAGLWTGSNKDGRELAAGASGRFAGGRCRRSMTGWDRDSGRRSAITGSIALDSPLRGDRASGSAFSKVGPLRSGSSLNSWYDAEARMEPPGSRKKKPARVGCDVEGRNTSATCHISGKRRLWRSRSDSERQISLRVCE